jgi:ribosome-associated translation inhibitor RaiA
MQTPLQITWRGLSRSAAIETTLQDAADKMEKVYGRIVSCRIVVEQIDRHKRHGRQFTVHLDVRVPGAEIAIVREHDEDVYIALRNAFADARRKLAERRKARKARTKKARRKAPAPD